MGIGAWIAIGVVGLIVAWLVIGCICGCCKKRGECSR